MAGTVSTWSVIHGLMRAALATCTRRITSTTRPAPRRMSIQDWVAVVPRPRAQRPVETWLAAPDTHPRVRPAWTLAEALTVYSQLSQVYEHGVCPSPSAEEEQRAARALAVLYVALVDDPAMRRGPS